MSYAVVVLHELGEPKVEVIGSWAFEENAELWRDEHLPHGIVVPVQDIADATNYLKGRG